MLKQAPLALWQLRANAATEAQVYKDNIILQLETNCSIIEKIPPKGESFSDFIATFAMSVGFDTYFDLRN